MLGRIPLKALGKGSVASFVEIALQVAWWVLGACLGILVLAALGYGIVYALIGAGAVNESLLSGAQASLASDGVSVSYGLGREGTTLATWPVVAPALAIGAVVLTGALVIVWRLRKLFKSFTSGAPFQRENATHLRVIWITMLVMEITRYLLLALIAALFSATGAPEGTEVNFRVSVDVSSWLSIAVLIVLAEVFREGARMKEEQELTI
jgi:hypothetical protein